MERRVNSAFWHDVLRTDLAVPGDRPLNELTAELVTALGSASSSERVDIGYRVLRSWVASGVYDDLLVSFGDAICNGLRVGLGRNGDDTVYRRAFSALVLAECVRRDNVATVLPVDAVLGWADRAFSWLVRERDLRSQVAGNGLGSTVICGAGLLAALAQSRHLQAAQLGVVLDVIGERATASAAPTLVDGEDDQLAAAALLVVYRNSVDSTELEAWVDTLAAALDRPADHPADAVWPTAAARNTSNFLRAVHAHLAIGIAPQDATISTATAPGSRGDLLVALQRAIPRFTPELYAGG